MQSIGSILNFMRGKMWQVHSKNGWKPIIQRRFDRNIEWYGRLQEWMKTTGA